MATLVSDVRLLEIILIIFALLLSVQFLLPATLGKVKKQKAIGGLSLIGISVLVVHALIEGMRWQLIPIYIPVLLLFLSGIYRFLQTFRIEHGLLVPIDEHPRRKLGIVAAVAIIALVTTSVYLDSLLPVFVLPEPTGSYEVGTTTFALTDMSRNETFTQSTDDYRRILVQSWYPAGDISGHATAPYIYNPTTFTRGIESSWGFPSLIVSHFALVKTHSYQDAPLSPAESSYPVLLFSHGYGGLIMQNTVLMEELASHGYIVFSIAHPYEATVVDFPDGTTIYEATPEEYSNIQNSLNIWANDTMFLLDQLEITNNPDIPSILWNGLDLTHIGILGHSFGGTTAEQVILADARVSAGISFDPPHGGLSLQMNLTKPFMLMFGPDFGNPEMNDTVYNRSESLCYGLYINGTRHHNFADPNMWSPLLRTVGLLGSIDGYRMLELQNRYVVAFFNQHIKGTFSQLLDGPSTDYPEVLFYSNAI
ncbi:hypothetical protein EU522_01040 [Candidatus Thorarchaeota archaeon]|nr:MAG: hypothetical protein EU522_01040 [Candidatus Thorarchaeota archaeon]